MCGCELIWKQGMFPCRSRPLSVPFCAAVVHERDELLHRPVECYGHAWPFLFHCRNCISVSSPLGFSQFQEGWVLGRKGKGEIFGIKPKISQFPTIQRWFQKATVPASGRHSC